MFPSSSAASGLTFTKVIGGISKTLGVVNQAIPIYKEIKPIAGKARDMYAIFKEFGNATSTKFSSNSNLNKNNSRMTNDNVLTASFKEVIPNKKNNDDLNPVFFN